MFGEFWSDITYIILYEDWKFNVKMFRYEKSYN